MLEWPISHPGAKASTQIEGEVDIEDLCRKVEPLEEVSFYNEGEDQIAWEFHIKDHVIPPNETVYEHFRFNLPIEDGETYYLVGAEALVDNEEMVHHYIVTSCEERIDESQEGLLYEDADGFEGCQETIWGWAPGGKFKVPREAGFPLGKGARKVAIQVQMHYDNPQLIPNRRDGSGLRFHLTKTPRQYQAGIMLAGGVVSVGVIPPKKRVYSATVFQVKVDTTVAPNGITVFGFGPHMHALGKKLWVERLRKKPGLEGNLLVDLKDLEKVEDIARDDTWDIDLQGTQDVELLHIKDGEFIATTCIFDSESKDTPTPGGLSSQEEMCVGFLSFFPAEGADTVLTYSGPIFFHELDDEEYDSVTSFIDILHLPESNTHLPRWREAYLTGELVCPWKNINDENRLNMSKRVGLHLTEEIRNDIFAKCGKVLGSLFFFGIDALEKPECSTECATLLYEILGCSLVTYGVDSDGKPMELYPSNAEAHVQDWCGAEFPEVYKNLQMASRESTGSP